MMGTPTARLKSEICGAYMDENLGTLWRVAQA